MRPVEKIRQLCKIVRPDHVTTIVDIGANPFIGSPPYGVLRRSDCCKVVGFEPQPEALKALKDNARHNDLFLPYAVGDGSRKTLFITRNSGLVSTLRPVQTIADLLGPWWRRATEVTTTVETKTEKLDDIAEVQRMDFLKIDIQGGELDVFRNADEKLSECAAIQTEICLHPYYEGQPSFGEIQSHLSKLGFIAHKFVEMSAHAISNNLRLGKTAKTHRSQLTVADLIFIKDPTKFSTTNIEVIKQMLILSYSVFRSYDLTLRCMSDLKTRNELSNADISKITQLLDL